MQDSVEEVLVLLHKILGELQFPFIKNYIVAAAKRIGADIFKIAGPEIGEVVSGRKKTQNICKKILEKKEFENSGEVEKTNPSIELE